MGNYKEESDNEFDVDEPAELQENSDDDWAPARGKRSSTGSKRGPPSKKKKKDDDEDKSKKKASKVKTPPKSKSTTKEKTKQVKEKEEDSTGEDEEDEEYDDDAEEEEDEEVGSSITPKEFSSGAFIVRKSDFNSLEEPPLWRIDGKALLQKYMPEKIDGKTLYRNTSSYSGWNINNKDQFLPAPVVFKQQTRKDHVVEFQRDSMQKTLPAK